MTTVDQGLAPSYGPFVTASSTLVTFLQRKENMWTAKAQETTSLVREQQLNVGCAGDVSQTLLQGNA